MNDHTPDPEPITTWPDALESAIEGTVIERVMVLEETQSTQDAASRACLGLGLDHQATLVVAGRQLKGRGQRDKDWHDAPGCTLPCSIAIGPDLLDMSNASIAARAGLAALDTIRAVAPSVPWRIKWPNDIVVVSEIGKSARKVAGVLIEHADNSVVIGFGINCSQTDSDWIPSIRDRAVSLRKLGAHCTRRELACVLIKSFDHWLGDPDTRASDARVRAHWEAHDAMRGTNATLVCNNAKTTGKILRIDPLGSICVHTDAGERLLPVEQTTLVHNA